jgi:hypothetical protein
VDPADGGGKIDMKRSWNWSLWIGFLFALAGFLSYTFFAQFPVTRDFPWANLLLFAAGGIFLVLGLFRAFGKAQVYRGKVFGPILATLGILMFGSFPMYFSTSCGRCRPRRERRGSDKKHPTSRCWIKTARTWPSVISSADRKQLR